MPNLLLNMRRIIIVSQSWFGKVSAFSNLQKAMKYLEKEHKVIFVDSYRTITEKLQYENKFTVKIQNGIFGEIEFTIQRISIQ